MLYDTHMHTRFSGDSDAAPEDMIKAAREKGLTGLCFTDHLDIDYREEPHLFDLDFEKYFREMPVIKEKNESDDFHIGIGIEMGLQPYLAPKHHELLKKYDLDKVKRERWLHHIHKQDILDLNLKYLLEGLLVTEESL